MGASVGPLCPDLPHVAAACNPLPFLSLSLSFLAITILFIIKIHHEEQIRPYTEIWNGPCQNVQYHTLKCNSFLPTKQITLHSYHHLPFWSFVCLIWDFDPVTWHLFPAPCFGSMEFQPLDCQISLIFLFLLFSFFAHLPFYITCISCARAQLHTPSFLLTGYVWPHHLAPQGKAVIPPST